MSRITYEDEFGEIRIKIVNYDECRYKTNGICYNNSDIKRLGKKCMRCEGGERWKEKKRLKNSGKAHEKKEGQSTKGII